jgi:pre-mRNA-splicing factor CWC22
MAKIKGRFTDPFMAEIFRGLFPTDNPRNTRFAINYWTSIGKARAAFSPRRFQPFF